MKKLKTIISESKSGRILSEDSSPMTDMDFQGLENCVSSDIPEFFEQIQKRHPTAQERALRMDIFDDDGTITE
jgi:hypothetical protein